MSLKTSHTLFSKHICYHSAFLNPFMEHRDRKFKIHNIPRNLRMVCDPWLQCEVASCINPFVLMWVLVWPLNSGAKLTSLAMKVLHAVFLCRTLRAPHWKFAVQCTHRPFSLSKKILWNPRCHFYTSTSFTLNYDFCHCATGTVSYLKSHDSNTFKIFLLVPYMLLVIIEL